MKALSSFCHFLHDLACVLFWAILCVRAGGKPGRARRGGDGGDRRREGGAGVAVQGEAADAALLQEDPVRGAQAQRREAAADEGPLRQARRRRRHRRRRHGVRRVALHGGSLICRPRARHEITQEQNNSSKLH